MRPIAAAVLALLALFLQPAPPAPPTAYWSSSISAHISWQQSARACLYREPASSASVFIGCYEGTGPATVQLGGPQTDGMHRPTVGDVYRVVVDGVTYRALLRGVVLLPVMRA